MKSLFYWSLCLIMLSSPLLSVAQKDTATTAKDTTGWEIGGGIGLDFSQLAFLNPKVGAGESRMAIGGNSSFYARYEDGRFSTDNSLTVNFGVQRLGAPSNPFQKTVDELRLALSVNQDFLDENPWSYAADFLFVTQLTPTYLGNVLTDTASNSRTNPIANFFSPATLTFTPGLGYQPNKKFSFLLSPLSLKAIIVADDSIAQLGNAEDNVSLHGNPWNRDPATGEVTYENVFLQLGAAFRARYQDKFFKDKEGKARIVLNSTLNLYSNYLKNPQNLDVEWITALDLVLFKGLSLSFNTNLSYDHDILVQVDRDNDSSTGANGYEGTGRRVSVVQTFLLKYNHLF